MEKVWLFFCVFSCWISQIASSDASVRVQIGEDIILNCSMRNQYEVAWYHLSPTTEQLILLTAAEKDPSGRKLLINYNQNSSRLTLTADTWITTVSLLISGVAESDLGLYYCGTKSDIPEMYFNTPVRLEDWDTDHLEQDETNVEAESTDDVTLKERALMFGGVGLATVVFFLTTVIAGAVIHHRGWQKGWAAANHQRNHKSAK